MSSRYMTHAFDAEAVLAVRRNTLQHILARCSMLQHVAACCSDM
eukprot:CAMPEP_0179485306 /NCGR_PEP_ID=MMETSP0799-20121207/61961_1 /TAXON_ID=46947 /ORGANISM="Geminigera cryophila, Strain CCMP2564" /LENGTH=43 /DNA_ID= /DNA_START= /DNA_END= /DNA_ORIENTATION=